jgi:hypothetical protein
MAGMTPGRLPHSKELNLMLFHVRILQKDPEGPLSLW